ncbi:COG3904 family protein [Parasphingopyxis marina]|nr:hypothetical protein [Parasphingopyxis marina]
MTRMKFLIAVAAAVLSASAAPALQSDRNNPTCPANPNWAGNQRMTLTPLDSGGVKVLLAEGVIDEGLPDRLQRALEQNPDAAEIWFRSPGGNALSGNEAGRLLRTQYPGIVTRIPAGWTCFSACNFVFMGGQLRVIEAGGNFMVHMFTHTGNRQAIRQGVSGGTDEAVALIGEIEQSSAQLATEDNDFLIRMGVSRRLLSEVMYATRATGEGETRRCLTQDEAYEYNVANVRE